MGLNAGDRLGPYEVEAAIGAGGMGEVYRARDTRLDRTVAVKVLPLHLSENPEHRQRLEREAKAISSLSHPHICSLFDIGHQGGVDYLVMEHLEGETLAERLRGGPLALSDVMRYGVEIADALDAAHRQGVVHRDLKPGNVMLTRSGSKLLDFGLAKTAGVAGPLSGMTAAATRTTPLTAQGTILGTFQYMAPEQLEGHPADERSDIFAFGAVLYEMATGHPAFQGKTQATLSASILKEQPRPLSAAAPLTPPALERLVETCLEKDPLERRQSMHDVALELKWIAEGGSKVGVPAAASTRRRGRERLWIASTVLLALATAALGIAYFGQPAPEARSIRAIVLPPEGTTFVPAGTTAGPVTVSPDGLFLAFVARGVDDGHAGLWVRPVNSLAAQPLAGTEGAARPFWSADSRRLAFFAGGKLRKIDRAGGPALTLCDAPDGRNGTWNREDVIVFSPSSSGGLHRVAAAGGETTLITEIDVERREDTHRYPWFLPDGRHFLYMVRIFGDGPTGLGTEVRIGSLDPDYEHRVLVRDALNAAFGSGYLLFTRDGTLMAQRFDPDALELRGDAVPIVENVRIDTLLSRAVYSVSENGVLAYQIGGADQDSQLTWYDRTGRAGGTAGEASNIFDHDLSRDGRRLAASISSPTIGFDLWVLDLERGVSTRLTFDPAVDGLGIWSPDGSDIIFSSNRAGNFDLYRKAASGAGVEEIVLQDSSDKFAADWSRDGRYLLYGRIEAGGSTKGDVWVVDLSAGGEPRPVLNSEFDEAAAGFSPDGNWIAYESDESSRDEVYVVPFPASGAKWQISTAGGSRPSWNPEGGELFFVNSGGKMTVVAIDTSGATPVVGEERPLFDLIRPDVPGRSYSVSADGQRFLVNDPVESGVVPITLVVNWPADL